MFLKSANPPQEHDDRGQTSRVGAAGVLGAALCGVVPVFGVLLTGKALPATTIAWSIPIDSFTIGAIAGWPRREAELGNEMNYPEIFPNTYECIPSTNRISVTRK